MAGLESIDHVILLMLENRSFDHMLGYLYPRSGDFDGLDGTQSNRDPAGTAVSVYPITPENQNGYYYPLANPAEGYLATNEQLFTATAPADGKAANDGFVTSFAGELANPTHPHDPEMIRAHPRDVGLALPDGVSRALVTAARCDPRGEALVCVRCSTSLLMAVGVDGPRQSLATSPANRSGAGI